MRKVRRLGILAGLSGLLAGVVVVVGGAPIASAGGSSGTGGSWSGPTLVDQTYSPHSAGMSCPSATYCVDVDQSGDAITYNGTSWSAPVQIDPKVNGNGEWLTGVSCPTTSFCAAIDSLGYAVTYNGTSWSAPVLVSGPGSGGGGTNALELLAISCPSATFCVAVDNNGDTSDFNGSSWSVPAQIDPATAATNNAVPWIEGVSCASTVMCVAVDNQGQALVFNGSSWGAPRLVDPFSSTNTGDLQNVSCPATNFCVADDSSGSVLTFDGSTWSAPLPVVPDASMMGMVSCSGPKFCMAGINAATGSSFHGDVVSYDGTSWSAPSNVATGGGDIVSMSCPSPAFCAGADDGNGNAYLYTASNTVPGAPTNVIATPANASADLSWTAPTSPGGCAISGYVVDVYQGTNLVSSTPTASTSTTYTATALTNGTRYTFTVAATNCDGTGPASAASQPVIPSQPTTPAPYNALTPYRVCDTRAGNPSGLSGIDAQCAGKTLTPGGTLDIQVAGTNPNGQSSGGVPASGATAVVLNVTATNATAPSYFSVYPTGTQAPLASNLNFVAGETVPNLVEVALGKNSQATVFNDAGSADVVVDVEGYVGPASSGAGLYNPLVPSRICDTRAGNPSGLSGAAGQCSALGALGGGKSMDVQVAGIGGVPSSGVAAVALNVAVTDTTGASYLTAWPAGVTQPLVSNLNWAAGETVPSRVIVPVSKSGQVSLFNFAGSADVVIDVGGWYTLPGGSGSSLTQFSGITPARILDTRTGSGEPYSGGTLGPKATLAVQVSGVGGVPSNATAVVLNVAVTNTSAPSYLTVWPTGAAQPTASDLNWAMGETVPNLVIVKLGSAGQVSFFNFAGSPDVIADVVGWYQ
ncbi:MAG: fibronectin type III domain-containing protein [Acidimicrobiales bacterium]